jgi:hypothetical protein
VGNYKLYFGLWGPRAAPALTIYRDNNPIFEVRLVRRNVTGDAVAHRLDVKGKKLPAKSKESLRRTVLAHAKVIGTPILEKKTYIELGRFSAKGELRNPATFLRRVVAVGITFDQLKRDAIRAASGKGRLPAGAIIRNTDYAKGVSVKYTLDAKFDSQKRHQSMLARLQEQLWEDGYVALSAHPCDLVAIRKKVHVIIEAKGWPSKKVTEALRLAVGQLLFYAAGYWETARRRPHLVALVSARPTDTVIELVESLGIGVAWPKEKLMFEGSKLAKKALSVL